MFRQVTRVPAKDNDGTDDHSSDSYLKSFLQRFCALGDTCFFIGLFLLPWNRIVKSKNYFYFSTPAPSNICWHCSLQGLLMSWKRTVLNVDHRYYIERKSNSFHCFNEKLYTVIIKYCNFYCVAMLSWRGRGFKVLLLSKNSLVFFLQISKACLFDTSLAKSWASNFIQRLFPLRASLGFHGPPLFTFKTHRLDFRGLDRG